MLNWRRYIGLAMIGASATVQAANVTIAVSATVLAVHCTTEQRARIRACATPEQQTSIAPYKTMVTMESRPGQSDGVAAHQEIRPVAPHVVQLRGRRVRELMLDAERPLLDLGVPRLRRLVHGERSSGLWPVEQRQS